MCTCSFDCSAMSPLAAKRNAVQCSLVIEDQLDICKQLASDVKCISLS